MTEPLDRTDQGWQRIIPGAERSARQAAQAREDRYRGRKGTTRPQLAPAGMFERKPAPEPELPLQQENRK